MKLWLVRHSTPRINKGTCYGQLDVDVDEDGLRLAAKNLSLSLPMSAPVYSSSLIRAKDLANAIYNLRPDLPFLIDERLNEVNFGKWEGVAWDLIPKQVIDDWVQDFPTHPFGEGESVQDVIDRARSILTQFKELNDLIFITHAGVIRAFNFLANNQFARLTTLEMWPRDVIAFGELQCISVDIFNE